MTANKPANNGLRRDYTQNGLWRDTRSAAADAGVHAGQKTNIARDHKFHARGGQKEGAPQKDIKCQNNKTNCAQHYKAVCCFERSASIDGRPARRPLCVPATLPRRSSPVSSSPEAPLSWRASAATGATSLPPIPLSELVTRRAAADASEPDSVPSLKAGVSAFASTVLQLRLSCSIPGLPSVTRRRSCERKEMYKEKGVS